LRRACILSAIVFTVVLCVSGIGLAAKPQTEKNQIVVEASCKNGQSYTFVINGMSKTGDVKASTSNVVVKQYTVDYYDVQGTLDDPDDPPESGDDVLVGSDTFVFGNKKVLDQENGDLIRCSGVARDIDVQGLGTVTAIYQFQAFVTPRGGA
jgi:hypothetical protein